MFHIHSQNTIRFWCSDDCQYKLQDIINDHYDVLALFKEGNLIKLQQIFDQAIKENYALKEENRDLKQRLKSRTRLPDKIQKHLEKLLKEKPLE
jgi:regulator of replication initiation timing